jgi:hypothetical protein
MPTELRSISADPGSEEFGEVSKVEDGSTLQVRVRSLSSGRIRNSGGYSDSLIPG